MTPVVSGSVATLALKPDQKMSGSTGCNTFIGTYLFSTTRLTLNIGTRTLAPCVTSELTAQQAAITRQFPQVRSYRINGQVLVLSNEVGRELFTYNKGS